MRNESLTAVTDRLRSFAGDGNPQVLLGPEAAAEETTLRRDVHEPRRDRQAAQALGLLCWCRHLARSASGSDPGPEDLATAVRLLGYVSRNWPPLVPERLGVLLADRASAARRVRAHIQDSPPAEALEAARLFIAGGMGQPMEPHVLEAAEFIRKGSAGIRSAYAARSAAGFRPAISLYEQALQRLPEGHPLWPVYLTKMGDAFFKWYLVSPDSSLFDQALTHLDRALREFQSAGHDHAQCHYLRASILVHHAKATSGINYLRESVEAAQAAVDLADADDPDLPSYLSRLADTQRALAAMPRFDRRRFLEAIATSRRAEATAREEGGVLWGECLASLAVKLTDYFTERPSETAFLDEALEMARLAVANLPEGTSNRPLANFTLGKVLLLDFERTNDPQTAVEAVRILQDLADDPPEWLREDAASLLSIARIRISQRTGATPDLAIAGGGAADDLLAVVMQAELLYQGEGMSADTASAPEVAEWLQQMCEDPSFSRHPPGIRARALAALGVVFLSVSTGTGLSTEPDRAAAEESAAALREALTTGGALWPGRAVALGNLATVLDIIASQRTIAMDSGGAREALREADQCAREALTLAPAGDPRREGLERLAADIWAQLKGRQPGGKAARPAWSRLRRPPGRRQLPPPPLERLVTAVDEGTRLLHCGEAGRAATSLTTAMEALEELSRRRPGPDVRTFVMNACRNLPAAACEAALAHDDPERGLELYERARTAMLALGLETRADTSKLRILAPGLAREYERLSQELDAIDAADADPHRLTGDHRGDYIRALHRQERKQPLVAEWEQQLTRIRQVKGLENFLLPLTAAQIRGQAAHGPIVILVTGELRTYALLVRHDAIRALPLPGAEPGELRRQAAHWQVALQTRDRSAREDMTRTLGWLWDGVTGPILDALGFRAAGPAASSLPRVWWSAPGPLAALPLHAAGRHHRAVSPGSGGDDTVMSRVVSSYIPTVLSLVSARTGGTSAAGLDRPLVIALGNTCGQPLPATAAEAKDLERRYPGATTLADAQATVETVVRALPAHRWVHFAGHGKAEPLDTGSSQLMLSDQGLTARQLSAMRLPECELAFLSVCESARVSELDAQATTVAGGFHLAGFRHVIGTLWAVEDEVAAELSHDFYDQLRGVPGTASPAVTLHDTIRVRRNRHPGQPDRWASHIHVGP